MFIKMEEIFLREIQLQRLWAGCLFFINEIGQCRSRITQVHKEKEYCVMYVLIDYKIHYRRFYRKTNTYLYIIKRNH